MYHLVCKVPQIVLITNSSAGPVGLLSVLIAMEKGATAAHAFRYKYVLGANDRKMKKSGSSNSAVTMFVAPRDHFLDNAGLSDPNSDQEGVEDGMLIEAPVTPEKLLAAPNATGSLGKADAYQMAEGSNAGLGEVGQMAEGSEHGSEKADEVTEGSQQASGSADRLAEAHTTNAPTPSTAPQVTLTARRFHAPSACVVLVSWPLLTWNFGVR